MFLYLKQITVTILENIKRTVYACILVVGHMYLNLYMISRYLLHLRLIYLSVYMCVCLFVMLCFLFHLGWEMVNALNGIMFPSSGCCLPDDICCGLP